MSSKYSDGYEWRIKGVLPKESDKTITIEGYYTCNDCPFYGHCELTKTGVLISDKVFAKCCTYLEEIARLIRIGVFKKFSDIMFVLTDEGILIKVEGRRKDEH